MKDPLSIHLIRNLLIDIHGKKVLVDSDVAEIYGVATREINKAVKNNREKFPDSYLISLNKSEKFEPVENFHRFNRLKHSTSLPKAFTEKGLYMLATILKSRRATKASMGFWYSDSGTAGLLTGWKDQ